MVRPGRDRLTGRVEVDEIFTAGVDEGTRGRHTGRKALIVIAAQEDGPGIGRIRMRRILDASAESLMPLVKETIEPGSTVHTDGWLGYLPVEAAGYDHEVTVLKGKAKAASELMPRVHRVASLLKRWQWVPTRERCLTNTSTITWTSSLSALTAAGLPTERSSSTAWHSRPSPSTPRPP